MIENVDLVAMIAVWIVACTVVAPIAARWMRRRRQQIEQESVAVDEAFEWPAPQTPTRRGH